MLKLIFSSESYLDRLVKRRFVVLGGVWYVDTLLERVLRCIPSASAVCDKCSSYRISAFWIYNFSNSDKASLSMICPSSISSIKTSIRVRNCIFSQQFIRVIPEPQLAVDFKYPI